MLCMEKFTPCEMLECPQTDGLLPIMAEPHGFKFVLKMLIAMLMLSGYINTDGCHLLSHFQCLCLLVDSRAETPLRYGVSSDCCRWKVDVKLSSLRHTFVLDYFWEGL